MMQLSETWSIVIGISIPLLVLVITKLWDPVAEHLGYPFDVRRRVNDLGDAVERLQHIKSELLRLDPHPLSEQRVGWLRRVDKLIGKAEGIKAGLNCFTWCYFGKKAGKELKTAEELASQGKDLLQDARERPRPFRDVHRHRQDGLFGMDSYMKNVLRFVEDEHSGSSPLGIWGMGGVGKSSLLKLVKDSSSEYDNHILFVQADADCTVGKLQRAIATSMGLHSYSDETLLESIIFNHLKDKNFLLLLDDLWVHLDLEAVGIPMPLGTVPISGHRRKVIFTTRSRAVCTKMGCSSYNTIRMECLSNEDAWKLFIKMTGDNIKNDVRIHEHAKEIVEECSGLPMALCMIGQHMSDKKDHKEWRTTKELWKMSKLHIITTGHQHFFKRLKEGCYDNMTDDMKQCFLLCSLWSENENISMEDLIRWWIGLGFLDVSNGNDTGYTIIKVLVSASMLEKGDTGVDSTKNTHVKMHNMIRKMALWIVNKGGYQDILLPKSSYRPALTEENWRTVEKAWVSQEDTSRWCQWSSTIYFPQLKMLVAQHVFSLETIHYFEKITFLDMEGTKRDRFPSEICRLIHLQHLNLSATTIKALPLELKKLSNLKYLYIRNNMVLEIPKELILGLKSLRGLDLFRTGPNFPKAQYSSSLLEELARPAIDLPIFGFTVQTIADVTKLGMLKRVCTQALCMRYFEDESHMVTIKLQLLSALTRLRELAIVESSHSQALVAEGGPYYEQRLLPYLEIFELNNLPKLEKVTWKNAGMDITVVSIYKCDKLKDVTWVHHLNLLEQLTVSHCKELRTLIERELPLGVGMNQTARISFPILKKLKLEELPKLSMICKQACEFEELSYICVTRCNEMKNIQNQMYKQSLIKIDCSKDWWNQTTLPGFMPCLVPTFSS